MVTYRRGWQPPPSDPPSYLPMRLAWKVISLFTLSGSGSTRPSRLRNARTSETAVEMNAKNLWAGVSSIRWNSARETRRPYTRGLQGKQHHYQIPPHSREGSRSGRVRLTRC